MGNDKPQDFYLEPHLSVDSFVKEYQLDSYDYIFFQEFSHFNKLSKPVLACRGSSFTKEQSMTDLMNFYKQQMTFLATILEERLPKSTQVYYRLAKSHSNKWVPADKPLSDLPAPLSLEDCINGNFKFLWGCVYAMNQIASAAFQEHGHKVLDTSQVATLRPDAHPCSFSDNLDVLSDKGREIAPLDCNHFCEPGGVPEVMLDGLVA